MDRYTNVLLKYGQIHKRFVNIFTDLLTSYVIIFTTMGL